MGFSSYQVQLSSFEGPFDLLLHLIARRRLDVHEIAIAEITDDYLSVLRQMEVVDLEVATEFLLVAATLVELKAARLLPGTAEDEDEELALESRDLLYARLLEYRTFKQAARDIGVRLERGADHLPRAVGPEDLGDVRPPLTLDLDAYGLAALAARAFAERPAHEVDLSHVQPVRLSVREAAGMVTAELRRAGGRATFVELTRGCRHRIEVIVHLLALLELYRLEVVDLEQAERCGELVVRVEHDGDLETATLAVGGERL